MTLPLLRVARKSRPIQAAVDEPHYPNAAEWLADGLVHGVGIVAAAAGGVTLLVLALTSHGGGGLALATGLYDLCLLAMLGCSAAYNLTHATAARPFLRRLDEAAIFLMIAGSYTPFTTQRFTGLWAPGMTALVWTVALSGVAGKLVFTRLPEWLWTLVYVAFGWVALIAIRPLIDGLPLSALAMLVIGGLLYTTGTLVFHSQAPYRRAIWHGFVVVAAGVHFAAVCTGVVLAAPL
ncbi:MAG: hemolysin III family protein [Caulobacteraceae bacterium]|nr:hemolysin III family protein [Caulobacteraceae bacterium]